MRVAYAFNVQQEVEEAEAEFDMPETIEYVAGLLEELGHQVERLGEDGSLWFLEVNPLPGLLEGAGIYGAAALKGLGPADVVGAVVESALRRHATAVAS